ncbi:alkyl hydroperoxide reductase [Bradyrhizobium pachyrhizi]|uniref:carboxymuconolactone decarboxylase family protein n=1 Tax=Bradyrhizobium pachyrhizi TaxID=280333 RepID=UPI000704BF76|nr:carboxymuconolactone decarboxylase family protein [Bradyrhizobium pachyrhizi]KRP99759.1 alkyl hydroperoxide reductase [Bradyrhizobium pachyrhizi]
MTIDQLKGQIPDFAKDVRLNLASIVSDESLSEQTRYGLFLACAVAKRSLAVTSVFEAHVATKLTQAAKAAACLMAMNNIYYRFVHLASNKEYGTMPARLRMSKIGNPGVDKIDFELWSLAVSAIIGCDACIDAHEKRLQDDGVPAATIQTDIRLAAISEPADFGWERSPVTDTSTTAQRPM